MFKIDETEEEFIKNVKKGLNALGGVLEFKNNHVLVDTNYNGDEPNVRLEGLKMMIRPVVIDKLIDDGN